MCSKGHAPREVAIANLMAGRKAVDDQPNLRHGARAFLDTGKVPAEFEAVLHRAEAWRDRVLSEEGLGSDPEDSPKRLALIDSATRSQIVVALCFQDVMRWGLVIKNSDGHPVPNPILNFLARFEGTLAKSIDALGLDRKQRLITPAEYLQSISARTQEGDAEDPQEDPQNCD